ncbi:MAG: hypothetical protein KAW12_10415 [Candidatus Aminicenantes bacterium]|nr:hypothetical protein [Candidatus Aminicenantes bacterium]
MDAIQNYKTRILDEINNIPEEYFPSIFQILQSIKNISGKKKQGNSPTRRLLKLAGTLENPAGLSAKEYKKQVILEKLDRK